MLNESRKIFKKKIIMILCLIVLIMLSIFVIFSLLASNSFKLKGDNNISIDYNTKYKDKGTTNFLNFPVKTISNVDTTKIGKYKIKYEMKLLFLKFYNYRTVNVVDKKNPSITLKGDAEKTICPNASYEEEGYEAYDEYDGDLTDNVKVSPEDDIIKYEVNDSSNNSVSITRKIIKLDMESPIITLKGNNTVYVKAGTKYCDAGYNVSDNCDSNIEVEKEGNVNTGVVGKYTYTYKAKDSSGNESKVTRNIVVYKEEGTGVIYLTFDDGPSNSGSTKKILNTLKEEGVKATFFVTGAGNDSLIQEEYNDGHAIALHTYTHKYNQVYSSVENYFDDLKRIEDRVYNIIGIKPKIIRFPGGSNNTVSNNYCSGIMSVLRQEVVNRGYSYFDWNVSSGDAGGCTTSYCVYNNVINGLSKKKSNVVLMHDIRMYTADALSDIIKYAKLNGYTFKVIDESTQPVRFKW